MTVNIIIDPRRDEKFGPLRDELNRQSILDYRLWEATVLPESVPASISASHRKIVQEAKDLGLPECCIWEEDCMLKGTASWMMFIMAKPEMFDMYLAGCYNPVYRDDSDVKHLVRKVDAFVGLHCYIISSRYYDTFLVTPPNMHIDTAQANRGLFYVCNPMVAFQRPGWSANNKKDVDYNKM